ncbi:tRNA (N(6)-L-threonylcarbamoyladenosine(37)-C(2))-methylthiotransferase [Methanolapillus millepedarum]|uniref:tRNA-t(6)A37 methylthiotransferase n=1 Tax=Methanolapillus millepedarum TaxID=3028296 RepID=A0AA96V4J8_9EURY|nr:tRNA-2-methylthio-N(6)-dimethylallyladenosine synthase [Methanosarcinaceae archaeon Ac7]
MKIYFETFGCSANQASAETMLGIIRSMGFEISTEADAQVYVCNTCTVKYTTEQKILHKIRSFGDSGRYVVVSGCMPEVQLDLILNANPEAYVLGINSVADLKNVLLRIHADLLFRNGSNYSSVSDSGFVSGFVSRSVSDSALESFSSPIRIFSKSPDGFLNLPKVRYNSNIHICQISTGCNFGCSYCIVKLARGNLISFPPEEIVSDISAAVAEGCSEIWLTSQDDSQYGMDFKSDSPSFGIRLPELLSMIVQIPGNFKIRVGMMNPFSVLPILPRLVDAFSDPKIFKFLHLPIQSASENVLKTMNRRHKMVDVDFIIQTFQERFPDLTLFTDVIVGFCGESDDDFQKTVDWVKKYRPAKVNISKYSPRPGTKAFGLRNLDSRILTQRSKLLSEITDQIKLEDKNKRIGKIENVFVSKYGKESGVMARTDDYKPVVINQTDLKPGDMATVRIVDATPGYFIGELVRSK